MEVSILFGRFLVRQGLLTERDLAESVNVQSELNHNYPATVLGDEMITLDEFRKCLAYQRQNGVTFRQALLALNVANGDSIRAMDEAIRKSRIKLGEILVKRGHLTEDDLEKALQRFGEDAHR
jgi:hypothetical protein